MINTERNVNGVGSGGTATAHDKQLAGALRKTALRDVQNENVGSIHKQQESLLPGGGRSSGDAIKVCGTKRLTPERPSSSQGLPSLAYNESKNIGLLRQDIPQKITQPRDSNLHHIPVATSNNLTATMAFPSNGLSVPSSFGKHSNNTPAAKVYPELPRTVDSKTTSDQLRTERFIRLQKFLKQCDEANQREYTQMLLHLSPSELSKHAVELEKRAIQLTIEEALNSPRGLFTYWQAKETGVEKD
ncbi:UNVERIFIED_CONTAM: hypothetical protein Sangu_1903100 [Sesamum angustifolium]|uniref:Uncharacterized protein n=1 Tax=Sesamum angustifolium TaxID=2727405 RepID=A0AAW2LX25_9LAMI